MADGGDAGVCKTTEYSLLPGGLQHHEHDGYVEARCHYDFSLLIR